MSEYNFKVGDRVRIKGDCYDFTDHLDGCLGTILAVDYFCKDDCLVDVDGHPVPSDLSILGIRGYGIFKSNMTHVPVGESNA